MDILNRGNYVFREAELLLRPNPPPLFEEEEDKRGVKIDKFKFEEMNKTQALEGGGLGKSTGFPIG